MKRVLLIEAPAGYGKTTYLRKRFPNAVWLSLLPGEGTAEEVVGLLYDRLVGRQLDALPLHRLSRQIIKAVGAPTTVVIDNAEHLTSQAWDYLEGIVRQAPELKLAVAGRQLSTWVRLDQAVEEGLAKHYKGEAFSRLAGIEPPLKEHAVQAAFDTLPPEDQARLLAFAGIPRWPKAAIDAKPYIIRGLPILDEARAWTPHGFLYDLLIERAKVLAPQRLEENARKLEGSHPQVARQLWVALGRPEEVVRMASSMFYTTWLEQSRWGEVRLWFDPLPFSALGDLKGIYLLALVETKETERFLKFLEQAPTASLARSAHALYLFRQGRHEESLEEAQRAMELARHPLEYLLGERLGLLARMVLGEDVEEGLQAHVRATAGRWPVYHIAARALLAYWYARQRRDWTLAFEQAQKAFRSALELGNIPRAADVLDSLVISAIVRNHVDEALLRDIDQMREAAELGARTLLGPILYHEARLQIWARNFNAALDRLRKAEAELEDWPTLLQATIELQAEILAHLRRFDEAREVVVRDRTLVQMRPELKPGDPDLIEAIIDYHAGDLAAMDAHLQAAKAKGLNHANAEIARMLAGEPVEPSPYTLISVRLLGLEGTSERRPTLIVFGRDTGVWIGTRRAEVNPRAAAALLYLIHNPHASAEQIAKAAWNQDHADPKVRKTLARLIQQHLVTATGTTRDRRYDTIPNMVSQMQLIRELLRQHPERWREFAPEKILAGVDTPFVEGVRESWRSLLKVLLKEAVHKGRVIPDAHLLDPEDPAYLEELGTKAAREAVELLGLGEADTFR